MPVFSGSSSTAGAAASVTASGLLVEVTPQGVFYVARYVGKENAPGEIKRRRRSVYDCMRRLGTPVLVKHRFTDLDVRGGLADRSPQFDDVYGHSRNDDKLSHGVGYVSQQKATNEWYDATGRIVVSATKPGPTYTQAPKYRGYGPGYIVYLIEPDAALDYFQAEAGGPVFKVQTAMAQAPWFPDISDNDLLVNIELDEAGNITTTGERYEAKMVNPVSIRGNDRRGRREKGADGGNRYVVNQNFEMTLVPQQNNVIYNVECDR